VPDFQLHADFDRNGRLDASAAEYGRRAIDPGAIVVPNMDVDGRRLPASVSRGSRITIDRDQPVILASDDEALGLRLVATRATPAGTRFMLRIIGMARIRIRINDARGFILPNDTSRYPETYIPVALPAARGELNLTMTIRTLVGSPIGHVTDLNTRFRRNPTEESAFDVQLVGIDATGLETVHDRARFSVAPFVVLDNTVPAVRAYIVELGDNEPSITEFSDALQPLRVPLLRIPGGPEGANGDSWIQDQFQHALLQGADGWRQVLIHLPRLRSDVSDGTTRSNLAAVVTSHFPSRNLGLFEDLWLRELHVQDISGTIRKLRFQHCARLAVMMDKVWTVADLLVLNIKRQDPGWNRQPRASGANGEATWADHRAWLPQLVAEFRRLARQARDAQSHPRANMLDNIARDAQARIAAIETGLPMDVGRGVLGLTTDAGPIQVSAREADRIYERVWQMHHSVNYGGNIEASPPTPDAPFGKLVIGNAVIAERRDFMDPDLLQLLYKQRKQPVVEIDTTWLDVGHVDELMAFAPDRRSSRSSFAILRASSSLAQRLLLEAERRYLAGLPAGHAHLDPRWRPSGTAISAGRLTDQGTAPVTRMFRGKLWTHVHQRPSGDQIPGVLEPPEIYQNVVYEMTGRSPSDPEPIELNIFGMFFYPGEGEDRVYPADMTVREARFGEEDPQGNSTNRFIETAFLAPAVQRLRRDFPDARILPLPVLFDAVPSVTQWQENRWRFATSAFTPDVVNMQVIGGRLIVPRPYGPRMRLADAIAVMTAATEGMELPSTLLRRIDERFVRRHQLRTGIYWVKRQPFLSFQRRSGTLTTAHEGLETAAQVIEQFRDSFPGADDAELRRRIIDPNRRHFDANDQLRDGWRRFEIVDDMVDLFETFTLAVAEELDATVSWVDSWYYHCRKGEIHCGTNVLRLPTGRRSLPNVWNAPTIQYEQTIELDEWRVP
jgi:hypothetical protein